MEVDEGARHAPRKRKIEQTGDHVWELDSLRRDLSASPCPGVPGALRRARTDGMMMLMMHDGDDGQTAGQASAQGTRDAQHAAGAKRFRERAHVFIRTLAGRTILLDLEDVVTAITVQDVLDKLEEVTATAQVAVRLVLNNTVLRSPNATIPTGALLHVVQQCGTEGHPTRFVRVLR